MALDDSQARFCASPATHVRLLAPAGSGKTLSLLERCKHLSRLQPERTQRFLIFTFTRAARDELKQRINTDDTFLDLRQRVRIDTLNRWGYNYLRNQVNSSLALKTSRREMFSLVKHNLRPIWTKNATIDSVISRNQRKFVDLMRVMDALKTSGFRHDAQNLLDAFAKHLAWLEGCGLQRYFEAKIERQLEEIGLVNRKAASRVEKLSQFIKFWKQACEHLWTSAIITLDDQKYWALLKLQERYAESSFPEPNRYHHIMVDEFQDINPLDLFLVQELVRVNRSSLAIVGDDDQAIFEWRGAVPEFILRPDDFFGVSFETYTLETNYRSPPNILHHSQQLIAHNRSRVPKRVSTANSMPAEIVHRCFPCHDDAAGFALQLARQANLDGTPKGLAVLSRKKSQLIPLQIMLASESIPFYAKEDLNVLLSEAFEDLKTILEAVATKNDRRSVNDIVRAFIRCCDKVDAYQLPQSCSRPLYGYLMSKRPRTFMNCLDAFQSYTGSLRSGSRRTDTLQYALPIATVMEARTVAEAIELIEREMAGLRKHYAKGEDDIFYKDPPFLHLAEYARRYDDSFLKFVDDVEEAIASMSYPADADADSDAVDDDLLHPVHLMTALRAKGKEYDCVVILDVNDGMWPIRFAETEAELEQERRVFYVAVTRARKRLLMLSVGEIARRPVSLSPYIEEMGLGHIVEATRSVSEPCKERTDRNPTVGKTQVEAGPVEVCIQLSSLCHEVLAKLKELGFKELARAVSVNKVVGTIDGNQLQALAFLPEVLFIHPSN